LKKFEKSGQAGMSGRGNGSDGIKDLMVAPYRRIIVLHLAIIASGFVLSAMNEPLAGLLILIVFKTHNSHNTK